MTTKELFEWVIEAQEWHENHWTDEQANRSRAYKKDCLKETNCEYNEAELELATILVCEYWNDVQDWVKL